MACSMPGFPVFYHLPEFAQTRAHWVGDAIQSSRPVIPFPSCLQSFPASGSFQMRWLFASGGRNIRVSASASVLPVNIQGWFPLGLTGLNSLLSKGLTTVFSSTTVWKHLFLVDSLLYGSALTSIHDYGKNQAHSPQYLFPHPDPHLSSCL